MDVTGPEEPLLLHPRTVGALLGGMSVKWTYDRIRDGSLAPVVRVPRLMVPMSTVRAFIEARLEPAPGSPPRSAPAAPTPAKRVVRTAPPRPMSARRMETWRERASRCRRCPRRCDG